MINAPVIDMFASIRYASAVNNTMFIGMDQCFSSMDSFAFFPSDATYDSHNQFVT